MNLLLAPLLALFSVGFYRQVVRSPLYKGFLYLVYLSLIAGVLSAGLFMISDRSNFESFLDWMGSSLPPFLTLSKEGLAMEAKSPYVMKHPQYGAVAVFDVTKKEITVAEMGQTPIFFTSQNLYVRNREGFRIYSLQQTGEKAERKVSINNAFKKLRPFLDKMVVPFVGLGAFLFFFIWKLFAALFYSLVGSLINLFRTERLGYGAILNTAFFALTPAALLQFLSITAPALRFLPSGFFPSLILTTLYLVLAIKVTEPEPSV